MTTQLPPESELNREVELPAHRYFRCGNVKDLGEKMASLLGRQMTAEEKEALQARIAAAYDWRRIAGQTVAVYERVLEDRSLQ